MALRFITRSDWQLSLSLAVSGSFWSQLDPMMAGPPSRERLVKKMNGLDSLQRGSGAHGRNGRGPAGAEDSSEIDDCSLAGRDDRGCGPPSARGNRRIDDYRRALPEQRQGFLNREVSSFEIDGYHLVEALFGHLFEQPEIAVACIYED